MEEELRNKKIFGLLGKNISYSFSQKYFTKKFDLLKLENNKYVNFDIACIDDFTNVIKQYKTALSGMNVTIPYKQQVFAYLDKIDKKAKKIGAVNTIKITKKGKLKGYNTDEYGFKKSLQPLLKKYHTKALILGTGGASKAVAYVLKKCNIDFKFVSRQSKNGAITYADISKDVLQEHLIIINCTPLGTYPNVEQCPNIPYQFLHEKHLLYDLIYNPEETLFLQKGKKQKAIVKNGLEMLELQAEKAWKIWNE